MSERTPDSPDERWPQAPEDQDQQAHSEQPQYGTPQENPQAAPGEQYGQQPPAYGPQYGQQPPAYGPQYGQQPYGMPGQPYVEQKSKLLGILLGGFGVHRFYLGHIGIGILQIVVTLVTFGVGAVWGFIEGIMILVGAEPFRRDARGIPLKE